MLEEPHEVLFDVDYEWGYSQFRYPRCIPCKCPSCSVWSHHVIHLKKGVAPVRCPLCGKIFDEAKYQGRAIQQFWKVFSKISFSFYANPWSPFLLPSWLENRLQSTELRSLEKQGGLFISRLLSPGYSMWMTGVPPFHRNCFIQASPTWSWGSKEPSSKERNSANPAKSRTTTA